MFFLNIKNKRYRQVRKGFLDFDRNINVEPSHWVYPSNITALALDIFLENALQYPKIITRVLKLFLEPTDGQSWHN